MIKLRGKFIAFEPRAGFKRGSKAQPEIRREIIYGHTCPICGNLMQAYFNTESAIDLWPYEETVVLSQGEKNMGEIRKIFPDNKAKLGSSCYKSTFHSATKSQKIVLKNHILKFEGLSNRVYGGDNFWEVGERTCVKAGFFSLREDMLIKDILCAYGYSHYDIAHYDLPSITLDKIVSATGQNFRKVLAVGNAPPVLLTDREALNGLYGSNYSSINWSLFSLLQQYRKK